MSYVKNHFSSYLPLERDSSVLKLLEFQVIFLSLIAYFVCSRIVLASKSNGIVFEIQNRARPHAIATVKRQRQQMIDAHFPETQT